MGANGSKPRALTKEGQRAGAKFDDVELHVISLTYKDLAGLSKGDKGGDSIDKATFLQNFPVPGLVGDRLFHALDSNKSGRISFDDFVVGLAVCCRGSLEEKMRFLFGVYDMNEDGLISRDELLLMLNQVPRTLLNIGIDPIDNSNSNPGLSPPFDRNSLTLEGESKAGDGSAPSHGVGRRHSRHNGSGSAAGDGVAGGPLLSARDSGSRDWSWARGSREEEGDSSSPGGKRLRSAFTNESIADQALKDFGDGDERPLTFKQFERWAQSTPAVQALLQGAFPSDAHFSLATSPTARRSTCESLSTVDSPRRSSSGRGAFGTPNSTRESRSAATAISAVAAWSASASARPVPVSTSRRGTPMRHRSLSREVGSLPSDVVVTGTAEQPQQLEQQKPQPQNPNQNQNQNHNQNQNQQPLLVVAARTPSRTLSRNTSYDNLLRSPLVGQGIASSPMARGFGAGSVNQPFPDMGPREGQGQGQGPVAGGGAPKVWRWGKGGEEFFKTPKPGSNEPAAWGDDSNEPGASDGKHTSGGDNGGAAALPKAGGGGGGGGGIRRDRDRELPGTTGRTRRRVPPSSASGTMVPRSGSGAIALPSTAADPAHSSTAAAAARARSFQRRSMSGSSNTYVIPGDEASLAGGPKLPPTTPRACSGGVGDGAPPKTPRHRNGGVESDKLSPSGAAATSDVTRKARKLAMMALAAETAVSKPGGDGSQPDTQDLLALANAAAMGEKPPARAPRRGKLMRILSQDSGAGMQHSANGGTAGGSGRRLMRMASQDETMRVQAGIVRANGRKKTPFRRANSLSAAEHERRGGQQQQRRQAALDGGAGGVANPNGHIVAVGVPPLDKASRGGSATTTYTAAVAVPPPGRTASPMTAASPRERASSNLGEIFGSSNYATDDRGAATGGPPPAGSSSSSSSNNNGLDVESGGASGGRTRRGHRRAMTGTAVAANGKGPAPAPPPMPTTIVMPSNDVSLGLPHSNISPLLKADRGVFPFMAVSREEEAANASAGAEAVVRDCLYNSHGMVALDGYLWKPGSIRLVKRWMMLVDNTLYYFVKPGDRKPRGVISLPGCIAEAISDGDESTGDEEQQVQVQKESRKSRVPNGYFGLRLMRPNNHGKDNTSRLFLAKSAQERDEWVAELRVASRVVPLEDIFELKALLRKGAFASVHRCVRKDSQEEYAVKVIDKTSLSSHEKSLLRGEIGALKLVSHPNVVRLEAVHEDPRSISIVMTLCRGGDLWDKVRSQPSRCFNADQARTVMRPLCEAVSYLHTLGILHRDIKPENILLVDDGDGSLGGVTLSDFGFSHQVSPKSRLACGKQLMGTPSYMAPESILHGMYGKEVDWFSCGCVLYMMLMGRAPFAGNSPSEIFRNTCHGRLGLGRGGASLWDKLPAAARELIVGLMQLDHNLRFTGEQAMSHRWLAMSAEEDDPPAPVFVPNERLGAGQASGPTEMNGNDLHGGGGTHETAETAAVGRRRNREGSRSGSRTSSRKGSRSAADGRMSSGGHGKSASAVPPPRWVVPGSSTTSFATTPPSSSGST